MARTNEELVYDIQQAKAAGKDEVVEKLSDELYEKNKGLIFETSLSYKNRFAENEADRDDLDSVAKESFIAAISSYNPTKGTTFATWAKYHEMEYALRAYVRENTLIHIPDKLQALIKLHDEIVETYKESHDGLIPSDKIILVEMNKRVKVTPKRFEDIKTGKEALAILSLDVPIDENGTTGEEIVDRIDFSMEVKSPEDTYFEKLEKQSIEEEHMLIKKLILKLPQIEQDILRMVYYEGKKQTEVAEILGRDKTYVCKKLKQAHLHLLKMKEVKDIGKERGWLSEN